MQAIPAHMARGHPSSDTISSAEETISVSLISVSYTHLTLPTKA